MKSSLKGKYAIVGLGLSRLGRVPKTSSAMLEAEAVEHAAQDAGLALSEIDGYIYQPSLSGQGDDFAPRYLGMAPRFHWAIQAGGASAVAMIQTAIGAIEMGLAHYVVCAYGDNLLSAGSPIGSNAGPYLSRIGMFGPAAVHALAARRHMYEYGTTPSQLGAVAVETRRHALKNPEAWFHNKPLSIEDYLASPYVVEPFRLPDLCLITDGGAAVIVTSAERATDLRQRPVRIAGLGFGHQLMQLRNQDEWLHLDVARARDTAFGMAGIKLRDLDLAQLYDCFTITVLMELEAYGFCNQGEGGAFVEAGNMASGAAIPINTGGGELSWAYLQGFTPLVEGVRQIRGQAAGRQVEDADLCLVGVHGSVTAGSMAPMTIGHGTLILSGP